jgi:hypothetical protein
MSDYAGFLRSRRWIVALFALALPIGAAELSPSAREAAEAAGLENPPICPPEGAIRRRRRGCRAVPSATSC